MQHVSVPNGTIGVLAQGKGTPILFVHGFPLTHSMWHSQVKAFAPTHRVIAPDLRGFGESGLPAGNGVGTLTMEALADDLHGLLHAVFVDGPVVLCGLSMGGYIAWQFFQQVPAAAEGADSLRHAGRGRHARRRPPDASSWPSRFWRRGRSRRSTQCCRGCCRAKTPSASRKLMADVRAHDPA